MRNDPESRLRLKYAILTVLFFMVLTQGIAVPCTVGMQIATSQHWKLFHINHSFCLTYRTKTFETTKDNNGRHNPLQKNEYGEKRERNTMQCYSSTR